MTLLALRLTLPLRTTTSATLFVDEQQGDACVMPDLPFSLPNCPLHCSALDAPAVLLTNGLVALLLAEPAALYPFTPCLYHSISNTGRD